MPGQHMPVSCKCDAILAVLFRVLVWVVLHEPGSDDKFGSSCRASTCVAVQLLLTNFTVKRRDECIFAWQQPLDPPLTNLTMTVRQECHSGSDSSMMQGRLQQFTTRKHLASPAVHHTSKTSRSRLTEGHNSELSWAVLALPSLSLLRVLVTTAVIDQAS